MRIGMVLKGKIPPPDIRVEKEAQTLIGQGHEVHLLLERGPGEPATEKVHGIECLRGVSMGPLRERWHRYTFSFTFRDRMWRKAIRDFARERNIEVLHIHDLPLVGEGVAVAGELGIPIIADLHENYPGGLQVWYTSRFKKKTIYNFKRWARYEREILRRVDGIIAVIEESKERLRKLGLPAQRIFVVPNTAHRERINIPLDPVIKERYRGRFVVSYIGGFAPHRGLDTVIRSLPLVREKVPEIRLVLVGNRNKPYQDYLARLAAGLNCADLVEMTGWQPFEKIWSYIDASDICLVPHARNPHTDTTIPHKIFQYMMVEKPVIVSDCPPLRRVIEDSGGGLVFRYDSPTELADSVIKLYGDEDFRREVGRAGRKAFLDRYHWDSTSGELIQLYDQLSGARRGNGKR
ncbi:MAG: glycosyltransferase family 4 protein [Candidatus Krumholzibacteriota bacterium]|nr:glycosyltransferase family 4 protein [Candidatus Krumholzibacteriota bacterium]